VRARGHLPAPSPKEHMQGVRGREHLPAPVIIFLQVLKKAQEERKEAEKRGQEEAKKGQEERKEAREAARKRKREEEAKAREEAQAKKKKKKKVVHDTGLPEATRMSKEVQNLLLNGGVFNLCLLAVFCRSRNPPTASFGVLFFGEQSFCRITRSSTLTWKAITKLTFGGVHRHPRRPVKP